MKDPYEVLGVPRNASEQDIKTAYRTLAKKYHPDNFATSPDLAAVAEEKMREVNEAYDAAIRDAKSGSSSAGSSSSSNSAGASYSQPTQTAKDKYGRDSSYYAKGDTYSTTTQFPNVRNLIYNNRFEDANAVLDSVPVDRRNAEWNFLKGTVYYRRGWLEQAYKHFEAAVNMDSTNSEFRAAFDQSSRMRSGSSGGYREGKGGNGCSPCSTCCSLLCADQCCECFGGDFITCC